MKKVFIFLPDGVGLRNFVFSDFPIIGKSKKIDVVYWNNTSFNLTELGFNEIRIKNSKINSLSDYVKSAKIRIQLNIFSKKFKDKVYKSYIFKNSITSFKSLIKTSLIFVLEFCFNSNFGIKLLNKWINFLETRTLFFKESLNTLKKEQPSFVFCSNQRPIKAIAPILAAKSLKIPTGTFIYSWDNLPKATMIVNTDYYFVWSEHMKNELLQYYSYISENQVCIVGTPQFELHFKAENQIDRKEFFSKYELNTNRKYICFSGDDVTTSPLDQNYLKDVAEGVRKLNSSGYNIGIIFRRCPVDFSDRYDMVLEEFEDVIVPINPIWVQNGDSWDTVMPTLEDNKLLSSIIKNSELVINLASSMVFDFCVFNKPCIYINYLHERSNLDWTPLKVYNFIHFKSMPTQDAVIWLNSKNDIEQKIVEALNKNNLLETKKWFEKIAGIQPEKASINIWNRIEKIIS